MLTSAALSMAGVAVATVLVYPLKEVTDPLSLGVVYLLPVLLVAVLRGFWPGVGCTVLSAGAFNLFHIPPTGGLTIDQRRDGVALAAFVVSATAASAVAELARRRAREAEERRAEAALQAQLTGVLLSAEPREARVAAAQEQLDAAPAEVRERVAPAVDALVAAGDERDRLAAGVVENEALRRADEVKTTLLRSVSHDLRSPLTGIVTSGHALASPSLQEGEREELAEGVVTEAQRLASMVDKLLDLTRLEAGAATPKPTDVALDEVLHEVAERAGPRVRVSADADLPLLRADAAQLERAFDNLVENALRVSGDKPVSVRARRVGSRLMVRVVDQGPGIPRDQQDRLFAAFVRGAADDGHLGSGLGLAIVRGFVQANGGTISVESLPGQGTSFVVAFPLETP